MFGARRLVQPLVRASCGVLGGAIAVVGSQHNKTFSDEGCAMCRMMKAGPCKEIFLPFEACLDKSIAEGDDSSKKCEEQFKPVIECLMKVCDRLMR
jgi:hypothetical protein